MHTHASWDGEQCCRRKFFFSSHQKAIFYFPSIKNGRFCEATTKWLIQNTTTIFYKKILYHIIWTMSQQGDPKAFRPPLVKKTNSCRIGRKWVRYELQVYDPMLMFFYKNQVHNMLFYQRSNESLARLGPELRIFMSAVR